MELKSLITNETRLKVSSTLNRDVKTFGKQYLIDRKRETCWNSDAGLPQWIQLDFNTSKDEDGDALVFDLGITDSTSMSATDKQEEAPRIPQLIRITFQGGFVAKSARLLSDEEGWKEFARIYPQDINDRQEFTLQHDKVVSRLRIVFDESTDFYGRITIYDLDILG